ncbi:RNA-binding post-transcriptional regulator cip2 [Phlyctema vagabunda]|uniref:RNA-binding post-transcriptional regulator cip2 n=1 Tax=Phlyctema vagabunda TaxID=108571 RepID=A0ABR4PXG2_9HELO
MSMNQQYPEMFTEYHPNRSPNSVRGYGNGNVLNRQPSRQFDHGYQPMPQQQQPQQQQQHFSHDDQHMNNFDTSRYDRMAQTSTIQSYPAYDSQTWSYGNGANTMGGTRGSRNTTSRRTALPTSWVDPQQSQQQQPLMPSLQTNQLSGLYNNNQPHHQNARVSPPGDGAEELIPTAIVIKNIPFAVKKEQLSELMVKMGLPLPYAFNYHFDNGVFRGLAFANFTTSEETQAVISMMNCFELQGRKLRVEYKKMLPPAERDRIERDKRERRGQLQEQHQPMSSSLQHQASMSSMNSAIPTTSPSPVHNMRVETMFGPDVDMNDAMTLSFYAELTVFKRDEGRQTMIFPPEISPQHRRAIHTLAHHMKLEHRSEGTDHERHVIVYKNVSPPTSHMASTIGYDSSRRSLNRAATIDFSEHRAAEATYHSHGLGHQTSSTLLVPAPSSPGLGGQNLRGVKSFADLRSFSPSPAQTHQSFSSHQNIGRYNDYASANGSSGTPNLTPTSSGPMDRGSDSYVLGSLANLNIGTYDRSATATRSNGRLVGQSDRDNHTATAGAIGSQRPTNGHYDESQRNGGSTMPERQPRGPGSTPGGEWGGFTGRQRQNGHANHGSDSSDRSIPLSSNNRFMS